VPGEALEERAQEDVPSAANDYGRLRIVPRFQEDGGGHEGGGFGEEDEYGQKGGSFEEEDEDEDEEEEKEGGI
jgi:hypothetical protein